ncbi:uncharacterized protein LOC118234666 [Anguilla anguilla]|uniref:uncharacterized protein LOC118234666 n=1 Tax=Anguilla anguilla TaxID=7936 RepID=UPI0015A9F681|nr:uncharacterized protein LOC118234666 [Anguilla anguilla]
MFPGLVTVHCVTHCLNLAVSDCINQGKGVPYLTQYSRTIGTIFWFYQGSSNRTNSFQEIEKVFELPELKLQGGNQTRWESNKEATDVIRIFPALFADLSLQARCEPTAHGLYNFVMNEFFPAALCLMQVVHDKLHRQFQMFQRRNLFLSQVEHETPLVKLKKRNLVKDRWHSWLTPETGLKPLQDEVPSYFAEGNEAIAGHVG